MIYAFTVLQQVTLCLLKGPAILGLGVCLKLLWINSLVSPCISYGGGRSFLEIATEISSHLIILKIRAAGSLSNVG